MQQLKLLDRLVEEHVDVQLVQCIAVASHLSITTVIIARTELNDFHHYISAELAFITQVLGGGDVRAL